MTSLVNRTKLSAVPLRSLRRMAGLEIIQMAEAAHPDQFVLRTAIALVLDPGFAPPQIAEHRHIAGQRSAAR